ncbi:tyrosine-type recombinase/integrase [Methylobacterium dankookense]|uniref:tyrosine-type recombinase/integrase n=1 Tax=Methylobacterium dankookense TaxID=560405 RepID=UPI00119F0F82|nr:tyrosine-type recombinase/integrase [Methylobacterium dankookense]
MEYVLARTPDPKKAYLELHGGTWRVTVSVPVAVRRALGATKLVHNLGTDSLREANVLKRKHVERFKRRIAEAMEAVGRPGVDDMKIAVEFSKIAEELKRKGSAEDWQEFQEAVYERHAEIRWKDARWVRVEDPEEGPNEIEEALPEQTEKAMLFSAISHGRATPVDLMHEDYRKQLFVKDRTRADDARALRLLQEWCKRERIPATLQEIDVRRAHAFADALVEMTGLHHVTLNKYIGRLSGYWQWMVPRTAAVSGNVFANVRLKGPKEKHDQKERPFKDSELADLLLGPAPPKLRDLMLIGALTGARLDAIVDLKVRDTAYNCFLFKPQKQEASARYVPIHPDLVELVARRTAGKRPEDDLFPEWPPVKKADSMRERSFKASNRFTEYRRSVGVDEVVAGKRRSLVNFHSFRRWFSSRMEQAGVPGEMISAIVGHKRSSITLDVYSEGPHMRAARRAIAKLKLPPLDGSPIRDEMTLRPRAHSR